MWITIYTWSGYSKRQSLTLAVAASLAWCFCRDSFIDTLTHIHVDTDAQGGAGTLRLRMHNTTVVTGLWGAFLFHNTRSIIFSHRGRISISLGRLGKDLACTSALAISIFIHGARAAAVARLCLETAPDMRINTQHSFYSRAAASFSLTTISQYQFARHTIHWATSPPELLFDIDTHVLT